jgi:hypothetical protein
MALKYTNMSHFKAVKITQIGIFGLKMYHLATLFPANTRESEIISQ